MSRAAKVGLGMLAGLALVVGMAWFWQDAILLELVAIAADRRTPVGPSRPIDWDSGPDPAGRTQRPADHRAKPADYRPLDAFWTKRGYAPVPGLVAQFDWKDIDQDCETTKDLQFWIREL